MQSQTQSESERLERLFLSSVSSEFTKKGYKVHLDKYLRTLGYSSLSELLSKSPKEIENELIEFIITLKERGCKYTSIINYVKPIVGCCKINDINLNTVKINRFIPKYSRNKNTRAYSIAEIQKLIDIADERMRVVILLSCSAGLRIGAIPDLSIGSIESVPSSDLYKITVYEGEPESYVTLCSSECKKAIDAYLQMRSIYGEDITKKSAPLIREQFDKRDPFAAAHPRRITRSALKLKLIEMAEAAGIRTRKAVEKGQIGASLSHRKEIPICNGFRYHYITTLVNSGLKTEHRFLLEGHNLKFNDSYYVHVSHNDLLQSYLLAHDNLIIDQSHKLQRKVEKLESEANLVQQLAAKIRILEQKVK